MSILQWWDERALPRLVDVVLTERTAGRWRERACSGVAGDVLEVGFGSGRNLPHFGADVTRVYAVEPADLAWRRAAERVRDFGRPVERVSLDAATLPLPDASVDAVVSTWTMCTIPDLSAALAEMRRVLRPGGEVHFVEHSLAPHDGVARLQRGLQPFWGPLSGGCHIDRDLPTELDRAGLDIDGMRTAYVMKTWPARPWSWFVTGRASDRETGR
jgi:SAM-dependent methyltransferase